MKLITQSPLLLLLLLLERSSASRGPPLEDVTVLDLALDSPVLIEGGEYLVFRGPPLLQEELAAVTCDTVGNYQIHSYDDYYADIFLQVSSVGLEDFVYRPSDSFYDHEVNQTFTFFVQQGEAFEVEVWLSENVTQGMILMCQQSPVQDLVLGAEATAPLGIISNQEDTSRYYKITMPKDNPHLYCTRSQRDFNWDTYPFSADIHLNDLDNQGGDDFDCSLSYDSTTDTCQATSEGTVILSILPQYHGHHNQGQDAPDQQYRVTRSTVTCFAGVVENVVMEDGRSSSRTPMNLARGTRHVFFYTTTMNTPGRLVCSILTDEANHLQSHYVNLHMVLDQEHQEYYRYELPECTSTANEACHLPTLADNTTVAITVTSTGYTGGATLECTLEEKEVETLELTAPTTAVELDAGEVQFLGVKPDPDLVTLASCTATTTSSDVVLSAVYPRGELPYLLGWTPYIDNDSLVITHSLKPNATMEWLAWPDPNEYWLSLTSYSEEGAQQQVEMDCRLTPIETLVFDEETRMSDTVVLPSTEGGMFVIDTQDFEFPLILGCSMTFVNGTWGGFTTYGGSTGLGFGSSDISPNGTSFTRPMEYAPIYDQIVLRVDVDDDEGILETTNERPSVRCFVDEVISSSSAVDRSGANVGPAKDNPDMAGFP